MSTLSPRRLAARLAVAAVLAIVAACGSDKSTGPGSTNLSGLWSLSVAISNAAAGLGCNGTGQLTINQSGNNFTGAVTGSVITCTGAGGTSSGSFDGALTGGQINGSSVSYDDGTGCVYTGTMSGNPVNRIAGTVTCGVASGGTIYQFTGPWSATR